MRKRAIPSLILLVLLSLNFTSCGQNNESDSHLMAIKNTVIYKGIDTNAAYDVRATGYRVDQI
jgi:hypothetical protein